MYRVNALSFPSATCSFLFRRTHTDGPTPLESILLVLKDHLSEIFAGVRTIEVLANKFCEGPHAIGANG